MQENTQPDQNPETNQNSGVQEEKPETADAVVNHEKTASGPTPEETKQQITESEDVEIRELLNYKAKETTTEQPSEPGSEKVEEPAQADTKQISEEERSEIASLIASSKAGEKTVSTAEGQGDHDMVTFDTIDIDQLNKQELVELLEDVVAEKDVSKIRNQIAKIKAAYLLRRKDDVDRELQEFTHGGGEEKDFVYHDDPLDKRYNSAFRQYKDHKARFAQDLEKQKQTNLSEKFRILEELKELISSEETLKKTYDEFKRLQDEWKEIGMVPAAELSNLWQSYHFLVEKFFDKVRINKELRDLDLKKNLDLKMALCEKTEELFVEKSIIKSFKLLQKYHDEWREIGPVPSEKKEELWNRFKAATDTINQRRKEHYKGLQEEQQKNLEAKKVLCEKAEQLIAVEAVSLKDWQKQTNELNEMIKVWKTIGRAPKAHNDEIWDRFKKSLDNFFERKRSFFAEVKEQQLNNYNLKLNLCVEAEALMDSTDWKKTTQNLINLQKEWKKIGPVPRRNSDKVWKRFRSACDTFFNKKSEHFKSLHASEAENLKLKKEIIASIIDLKVGEKKAENLKKLKEFQKKWMDIGFVPFQEKDKLQKQYREAIDQLIDKMEINKHELSAAGFEEKVEMLKSAPDADWRLSKERQHIQQKINRIQEDVTVWENNIGFFSSSQKSNQLKTEFERKIEKAKSEIEGLKAKLKLIDRA